ncbi:MAG: hypothetical protein Fur0022_15450 [Anaerolineales bacterium]
MPRPLVVLDVGGSEAFWEQMGMGEPDGVQITILNRTPVRAGRFPRIVAGDARGLPFPDQAFDLAFAHSVIEHLGSREGQCQMAAEMRRVARYFFVQTPNRNFPVEPHFLMPFIQFLPVEWRARILLGLKVEYFSERITTLARAREVAQEIMLLNRQELRQLFPRGQLVEEKVFGMTKSFTIFGDS